MVKWIDRVFDILYMAAWVIFILGVAIGMLIFDLRN